ncbi:DUF1048 domain-containing protein [Mycoplasma sp. P36-A1]|uniref:DUF1048 domain-containing protein n=1 Tax=Mycoplasma sp. P36-A1 TaxID=3252900 RepID=UPI003C2BA29F
MKKIKELIEATKRMKHDKKEYKKYVARVEKLPKDYHFVYKQIEKYLWEFSDFTGENTLNSLNDLLNMFEEGVLDNRDVYDITGEDVAEFAENIVKATSNSWIEKRKEKLNKNIQKHRK